MVLFNQIKQRFLVLCGYLISLVIVTLLTLMIIMLYFRGTVQKELFIYDKTYLLDALSFSLIQSAISTVISTILAIFLAKALLNSCLITRKIFLYLCSIIYALPVLIIILGLITVYGKYGWISKLTLLIGINWNSHMHGMYGIIFAHVILNLPQTTRLLVQSLEEQIINEHRFVSNFTNHGWKYFKFIEWPNIKKQTISCAITTFILCFTSFTTILLLSDNPHMSSLEVLTYQMLAYDYNPRIAVYLSIIQMLFCISLMMINNNSICVASEYYERHFVSKSNIGLKQNVINFSALIIGFLFLALPVIGVFTDSIINLSISNCNIHLLCKISIMSVLISFFSGIFSTILATLLIVSYCELCMEKKYYIGKIIEIISFMVISMPNSIIGFGLLILINDFFYSQNSFLISIVIMNIVMLIPYSIKMLERSIIETYNSNNLMCTMLNITGLTRFFMIEFNLLKVRFLKTIILSMIISLGDLNIISLFETDNFKTITSYLYTQLSTYHYNDAAVTTIVLMLIYLVLAVISEILNTKITGKS